MSTFGRAPAWGVGWKSFIKENADRFNVAYLQKTTLPYEDNYLDLDPVVKDPMGFPVIRITAEYKDNEKRMGVFVQDKMAQWFMEAGAIAVEKGPTGIMGPSTHAYGGTRMGDNRETNVVNRCGFSHEVPNLGVLGRLRDGHQWRPQSDPHCPSARLAHCRAPYSELEGDREGLRSAYFLRDSDPREPFPTSGVRPKAARYASVCFRLAPTFPRSSAPSEARDAPLEYAGR